ncbi:MAG TPA: type II toxin-antitoxin system Phd/YefM family antitoxin [Terriglobales bacterium]|jgi:prevent-host-death family protein|nr:type II toxin-antitoxin system Phd/YefM family antitoxin [Terriglobales bacterium]
MEKIAISEFKAKCLAVIDQVNKTKKSVVITRRGEPIAELIPAAAKVKRKEWLGSMKDTFEIVGDITESVIDMNEFEAYRD